MEEWRPVRSKVGMRKGDDKRRFTEFHSCNFLTKVTSISARLNLHVLQQEYRMGLYI